MRKKSHVSLSRYILDNVDNSILDNHRKAFIVGSVLPDCKPSFVTTKHNMEETFEIVQSFIEKLTVEVGENYKRISTAYCRRLGEVTHYLADYFTYPHNSIFDGNIKDHCIYEKELKHELKRYIKEDDININKRIADSFTTPTELCQYVKDIHRLYLKCDKTVQSDTHFIVALCNIVVEGILNILRVNSVSRAFA